MGESMLNDGTAIVLFNLFLTAVKEPEFEFTVGYVIWFFVRCAVLGPLLGVVLGFIFVYLVSLFNRKTSIEDKVSERERESARECEKERERARERKRERDREIARESGEIEPSRSSKHTLQGLPSRDKHRGRLLLLLRRRTLGA